jgi:hypothetical protein
MIRGRLHRHGRKGERAPGEEEYVEIDARELTDVFAAPRWLRDVGLTAWLLVGVALFLAGAVWFLSLIQVIVMPVLTAGVIASVAGPLVTWLQRHRVPRLAGAVLCTWSS